MSYNRGKGEAIKWLHANFNYEGEECLIWPLSRDNHGHGHFGFLGTRYKAHQVMCEWVNGPRPSPEHQAAHSCGNGHNGCVHPQHLSWKTASENQLDRREHGTHATNPWGNKGKVTIEMASAVLALKGKLPQAKIASQFGISCPTVRRIFNGKTKAARGDTTPTDWFESNRRGAETRRRKAEQSANS